MQHKGSGVFTAFDFRQGRLYDASDGPFPSVLYAWCGQNPLSLPNPAGSNSFFGFVYAGPATIEAEHNRYTLRTGQYFSIRENLSISGGMGIVIERRNYTCLNTLGGPLEAQGRLRYIDGCTDSLLIPPVLFGDPCLNALYFPATTRQTPHTHPSVRIGLVVAGQGECITPTATFSLQPGRIFVIHTHGVHHFRTFADSTMTILAYHPDSDFGPQDENHPMINRTLVNGISISNK